MATTVSVFALFVSILSLFYGMYFDAVEKEIALREEIRGMLISAIDIEIDAKSRLDDPIGDEIDYAAESKIDILLSAIASSEEEISLKLSFDEYYALTDLHSLYGDRESIIRYNILAVEAAEPGSQRSFAIYSLARAHIIFENFGAGLNKLYEALGEMKTPKIAADYNLLANIHIELAEVYVKNGDKDSARSALRNAKLIAPKIDSKSWRSNREREIEDLQKRVLDT